LNPRGEICSKISKFAESCTTLGGGSGAMLGVERRPPKAMAQERASVVAASRFGATREVILDRRTGPAAASRRMFFMKIVSDFPG
jgi:hypothetical protein